MSSVSEKILSGASDIWRGYHPAFHASNIAEQQQQQQQQQCQQQQQQAYLPNLHQQHHQNKVPVQAKPSPSSYMFMGFPEEADNHYQPNFNRNQWVFPQRSREQTRPEVFMPSHSKQAHTHMPTNINNTQISNHKLPGNMCGGPSLNIPPPGVFTSEHANDLRSGNNKIGHTLNLDTINHFHWEPLNSAIKPSTTMATITMPAVHQAPQNPPPKKKSAAPRKPRPSQKKAPKKKRTRNEECWARNKRKSARAKGESYTSVVGKTVAAKSVKPVDCSKCKFHCQTHITEEDRQNLFKKYWSLETFKEKVNFLSSCVEEFTPLRHISGRRAHSRRYMLKVDDKEVRVCKEFFITTFGVSESTVMTFMNKKRKDPVAIQDERGRRTPRNKTPEDTLKAVKEHISSYAETQNTPSPTKAEEVPSVQKMYRDYKGLCEENKDSPASISMYRKIYTDVKKKGKEAPPPPKETVGHKSKTMQKQEKPKKLLVDDSGIGDHYPHSGSDNEDESDVMASSNADSVPNFNQILPFITWEGKGSDQETMGGNGSRQWPKSYDQNRLPQTSSISSSFNSQTPSTSSSVYHPEKTSSTDSKGKKSSSKKGDKDVKKRPRNEESWGRNVRKRLRAKGEAYISVTGKQMEAKTVMDVDCSKCKFKCSARITEKQRKDLNTLYWSQDTYEKKIEFVTKNVQTYKPKRKMTGRKAFSRTYTFLIDGKEERVCKDFFTATLHISESTIATALGKTRIGPQAVKDLRGKHKPVNKTPEEVLKNVRDFVTQLTGMEPNQPKKTPEYQDLKRLYQAYKFACQTKGLKAASNGIFRIVLNKDFNIRGGNTPKKSVAATKAVSVKPKNVQVQQQDRAPCSFVAGDQQVGTNTLSYLPSTSGINPRHVGLSAPPAHVSIPQFLQNGLQLCYNH